MAAVPPNALELPIRSHSARGDRWAARPATPEPLAVDALGVVTLNVWFDPAHRKQRGDALISAIEASDADVFCLQEVTPALAGQLEESDVVRDGMEVVWGGGVLSGYGVGVLSRLPVGVAWELELQSLMGRSLLCATLDLEDGPFAIATAHLESTRAMRAERVQQLGTIFEALARQPRAVFCGDFNFDPSEPEEEALHLAYVDLWPRLRPDDPGYTEDTARNVMRLRKHGKHKQVRYDRVLARAPGWRPTEIALFADEPLRGGLFISDHFGVSARLERF